MTFTLICSLDYMPKTEEEDIVFTETIFRPPWMVPGSHMREIWCVWDVFALICALEILVLLLYVYVRMYVYAFSRAP